MQLPLLAVTGSLMIMAGSVGWLWSNPLQMSSVGDLALMRGSVNMMLFASAGVIVPLLYTWFVTGKSDPVMKRAVWPRASWAKLAAGPFIQPGVAFITGLLAGASVPFVTFLVNGWLRLGGATGIVSVNGLPAVFGLLVVGVFSDGAAGQGWNMTGLDDYLGVAGQGVTGLFTVAGYQADFPGQLQAQVIGILALSLWGFLIGILVCAPLGLLLHGLLRGGPPRVPRPAPEPEAGELPAGARAGEFVPFPVQDSHDG